MALVIRVREGERAKELARLVRQKVPTLSCSACGKRDFALIEQPEANLRTMLYRHLAGGGIEDAPVGQMLITLLCTNCGHVEQFGQAVLSGVDPAQYGHDVVND